MASIDDLATAIGAAGEGIGRIGSGITRSLSLANELRDEFARLGASDKATAIENLRRELETGQRIVSGLDDQTESLRRRVAILRGDDRPGGSPPGGTAVPASRSAPRRPGGRPPGVPATWTASNARNGKGRVWQRPGAAGDADTLRLMDPGEDYPYGYVRFYNEHNQPIGLDGKPGRRSATHIPVRKDGTYDIPEGWHDDAD